MEITIENEKERLVSIFAEQYAKGLIAMDEYERLLDFTGKAETNKEIEYIKKIIDTNNNYTPPLPNTPLPVLVPQRRLALFSFKKQAKKKVKVFGGTQELRFIESDFVDNRLELTIKLFGGTVNIHIPETVAVENTMRCFGGSFFMDNPTTPGLRMVNKLILEGKQFGGGIQVLYDSTY
jgi:hypothetical protein